jgi:uridine kinase
VKKAFEEFIRPTMNYADMIIPGARSNLVTVNFIV